MNMGTEYTFAFYAWTLTVYVTHTHAHMWQGQCKYIMNMCVYTL